MGAAGLASTIEAIKPVTPAGDGLHKARSLGVIFQHLSNLADGGVDAVVGVEENIFSPDSIDDLVAGDELPFPLN
jgi:hypothetical protein